MHMMMKHSRLVSPDESGFGRGLNRDLQDVSDCPDFFNSDLFMNCLDIKALKGRDIPAKGSALDLQNAYDYSSSMEPFRLLCNPVKSYRLMLGIRQHQTERVIL